MAELEERAVVSTDGAKIAYVTFGERQTSGQNRPLVISHGGLTIADEWFDTARPLADQRQVAVIERRGRGRSGDAQKHSLEQEIDDLAKVVDDLGGNVDLLGHSYGGAVSLGFALRTGFEGKLIMYEPTSSVNAPVGGEKLVPVQELFDTGEADKALELLYTSVLRMAADEVAGFRSSPLWEHHRSHLRTFLRECVALDGFAPTIEDCSVLRAPTAYLLGSEGDSWVKNHAAAFVERIKGMALLPVPGQAHIAHLTAPELLAARVKLAEELLDRE